jgi:hypothetical protein
LIKKILADFCLVSRICGNFRLRQPAKCVKQRDFDAFWRSEAIRFSDGQFCLAVETRDNAWQNLALRMESVRQ